jgi:hypothetical protein
MVHEDSADRDAAHLEDPAFLDLGDAHLGRPAIADMLPPHLDVPAQVLEERLHLALGPGRVPALEGRVLPLDPPRDQQMSEVYGVVRVTMRDQHA